MYIIDFFFFFFALRSVHTILGYRYKRKNDNNWRLTNNIIQICSSDSLNSLFATTVFSPPFIRTFIHSPSVCPFLFLAILSYMHRHTYAHACTFFLFSSPFLPSLHRVFIRRTEFYDFDRSFNLSRKINTRY